MRLRHIKAFATALVVLAIFTFVATETWACTSIMVGRKASADGSVMTSHTCDSHSDASTVIVVPPKKYAPGTKVLLTRRAEDDSGVMQRYRREPTGEIPQVAETYGYITAVYGIMNEHQLAIGESTFEGRPELQSDKGLIDCETLTRLMLERTKTARDAIRVGGELIDKYGWCDLGEALTIADTKEVWLMEIVGPGKGEVGAAWVARRVPDDHVSVVANGARIGEIDAADTENFIVSKKVKAHAERLGYWNPKSGEPFRFYDAYSPESRVEVATTRREWRVLDMLAPSLKLHPGSNHFPFSIKPEKPVTPERIMEIFRDTFEGTDFDTTKNLTITDEDGKTVKSPLANPFMPYEMNQLLKINGGWSWRGERALARWYCMYSTVTQSRGWLPDAVGGVVWFGYSNTAMSTYVPIYAGVTDLPESYKTDGRTTGFSHQSAWWAFNRAATLAAHRWGEMREDVAQVRDPMQKKFLFDQQSIDEKASELLKEDADKARAFLTETTRAACKKATEAYWDLGDLLWTKYDEKW